MDRNAVLDSAVHAARRVIDDELPKALLGIVSKAMLAGAYHSSRTNLMFAETCRHAFREACDAAAIRIAEVEGNAASGYASDLAIALVELRELTLAAFDGRAVKGFTEAAGGTIRERLANEMASDADRVTRDLAIGIAGGVYVERRRSGVSIDTRGGAAQVAIDSPKARQSMTVSQTATSGIDAEGLRGVLGQVREMLDAAGVAGEQRELIEDQTVALERELDQQQPEPGRVKRILSAIADKATEVGVEIAAKVIRDAAMS